MRRVTLPSPLTFVRNTLQPIRSVLAPAAAIVIGLLSLVPVANLIPQGHSAPQYRLVGDVWIGGTILVLGIAVCLARASRDRPRLWRTGAFAGIVDRWHGAPRATSGAIALIALLFYATIALLVFDGRAQMYDEVSQVLHANAHARGMLAWPTPTPPEFFSSLEIVDHAGRSFSHFPPGGPAMLAIGVVVGAVWLIVPLCGALAVLAFSFVARRLDARPAVSLAATLLFAFSPFMAFMSASHMNHVPALLWCLIGVAGLMRVMTASTPVPWAGLVSGLGFGAAATIRPVDALAFALPAAVWYLGLALRDTRRRADALASGVGVAIPLALLMWVNSRTTGSPLQFAYELLWGPEVGLGFHDAPWGEPHTALRGLELLSLYFFRLSQYLYETPVPSVLPALVTLALTRRFSAADRYVLTASALLASLYFVYWSDGGYLGPRFFIPMLPACSILTARLLPVVRERVGSGMVYRTVTYASIIAVLLALTVGLPQRLYERARVELASADWDADSAAKAAGVSGALVLVRESWATQRLARLWALGLNRADAGRFQAFVDQCILEHAVTDLESRNVRGAAALAALRPLMRDSARVEPGLVFNQRVEARLPGLEYSPVCNARIRDAREGVANLTPLLVPHRDGNIYARDLHARDTLLLAAYPGRPVYLLRASPQDPGAYRFTPLPRDSLWLTWSGHPEPVRGIESVTGAR